MLELFSFLTTAFLALWLVSFFSGQTSFRGEFSFTVFIMLLWCFPHRRLFVPQLCGLSMTLRYNGPVIFNSARCLFKYFLNKVMGHLFSPVTNILDVASRGFTRSLPPLVFVRSLEKMTNSVPPSSFLNEKSLTFISGCSCCPHNPKCIVKSHQIVLRSDQGVLSPNWPFSHNISSSSLVRLWASFGRFPIPSSQSFLAFPARICLDDRNSVSLTIDFG